MLTQRARYAVELRIRNDTLCPLSLSLCLCLSIYIYVCIYV